MYFRKIRIERKLAEKLLIFFLFEDCIFPSKMPFQKVVGNPSLPGSSGYNQLNDKRGVRASSLLQQRKTRAVLLISLSCKGHFSNSTSQRQNSALPAVLKTFLGFGLRCGGKVEGGGKGGGLCVCVLGWFVGFFFSFLP